MIEISQKCDQKCDGIANAYARKKDVKKSKVSV